MKKLKRIGRSLTPIVCSMLFLLSPAAHAQKEDSASLRGQRYCEIILAKGLTDYTVYNTWVFNKCPQQIWGKISSSQIKRETGASFVYFNGPHFWVADGYKNGQTAVMLKTSAGLTLQKAGALHINASNLIKSSAPYYKHAIQHQITLTYSAGKRIYELIDETGNAYVMQSFCTKKTPQSESSLAQLGAKLKLPKGWSFKTGVLKNEVVVQSTNTGVVVRDNFDNVYQKASGDVLRGNS